MTEPSRPAGAPANPVLPIALEAQQLFHRANEVQKAGDVPGAIELYSELIERWPELPDAYNNLAILLKTAKRLPAAIACLRRALLLTPHAVALHSNLGNMLWMELEFDEAMAEFNRAIAIDASRPETYHNKGLLYFSLGDYRAAVECFDKSLALKPDTRLVLWDRALALLAGGDLVRGFRAYDARFDLDDPSMGFDRKLQSIRSIKLPLWQGEDLAGRTLWVYAEQGFGDTIQFCRFLPAVARRGARIIFDAPPDLVRLLSNFSGIAELRTEGAAAPAADFHLPLMSLPGRLGITRETIPAETPYLMPPPAVTGPQLARPPGTRLTVGLVWAGRPQHANDRNRSIGLDQLLTLVDIPGIAFYSLQKGARAGDIAELGVKALVRDLAPQVQDFADTARLLQQLDLVITIDSAVAHLAGALGRPAVVLLPFTPDWRWLGGNDTTPWYPSLRLFRQKRPGDWKDVMRRVHDLLARTIARQR